MNDDLALTRTRLRREILPALRRENPQLDAALVRLAGSAREWLDVIDAQARPFAELPLDCAALARQAPAIRKRAIALTLDAAGLDYDASHLEQINRVICAPERGEVAVDIPSATLVRSYGRLAVRTAPTEVADLVAPEGPYVVRIWQPGDRMRPARLKGRSRKLSDLYIDAKVPRDVRATARVLVRITDATIVWAEHLGLAFGEPDLLVPNHALEPTRSGGSF